MLLYIFYNKNKMDVTWVFQMDVAWADASIESPEVDLQANLQLQVHEPPMEVPEPNVFVPDIPVLEQPLMTDEIRRASLYERLGPHAYVHEISLDTTVDLVHQQAEIERSIEASLVHDGIPIASLWRNLNLLRAVLFYPRGTPLSRATLARYIQQIARNGTRQSTPYRRVYRAIRNHELFLDLLI